MDYDQFDNSQYDKARALPAETMAQWADAVREAAPPASVSTVVDLGCGTGRFTRLLASIYDAEIVGLDPSETMLAQAGHLANDRIHFTSGSAESIPLSEQSVDLLFLSMVWHHIEDKSKAMAEFQRVLRPPGWVVLRAVTLETIDENEFNVFFPEALEIDRQRVPSRSGIREAFEGSGFFTTVERTVSQKFAGDPATYCEKIGMRNLSSLQVISDDAFERGMAALKQYIDTLPADHSIYERIDLFAFKLNASDGYSPSDG